MKDALSWQHLIAAFCFSYPVSSLLLLFRKLSTDSPLDLIARVITIYHDIAHYFASRTLPFLAVKVELFVSFSFLELGLISGFPKFRIDKPGILVTVVKMLVFITIMFYWWSSLAAVMTNSGLQQLISRLYSG